MSILQDLDPKYAKIHAQPSSAGRKSMIWIVLLVLSAISASWIAFKMQAASPAPTIERSPENFAQLAANDQAKTLKPLVGEQADAASGNSAGSAVIQELAMQNQARPDVSQKTNPPQPAESESGTPINPDQASKTDSGKPITPEKKPAEDKKSAGSTTERKPPNKPIKGATDEKKPPVSSKKATERDIDIITAIVR